ncbi:MAG: hypothetical protein Q7S01_00750 [bacterium]|nr:hypothetical protein [bacterium]
MSKKIVADRVIRIALSAARPKSQPLCQSVKLSGEYVEYYNFLRENGFENSSLMLKLGKKLLAFVVAQDQLGRAILVGPNDAHVPEDTTLIEALNLGPDSKKRVAKRSAE